MSFATSTVCVLNAAIRGGIISPCLLAILAVGLYTAKAHTLPVSYIRLSVSQDLIHMEVTFNPFELTFVSEVDDNKDGELNPAELKKHGDNIAKRVCHALHLSVGTNVVTAENMGMDPDMSGHHVRVRAHYRVDARGKPVTLASDLNSITSASHLTQVTFVSGGSKQLAQFDSMSRKATFANTSQHPKQPTQENEKSAKPNR